MSFSQKTFLFAIAEFLQSPTVTRIFLRICFFFNASQHFFSFMEIKLCSFLKVRSGFWLERKKLTILILKKLNSSPFLKNKVWQLLICFTLVVTSAEMLSDFFFFCCLGWPPQLVENLNFWKHEAYAWLVYLLQTLSSFNLFNFPLRSWASSGFSFIFSGSKQIKI